MKRTSIILGLFIGLTLSFGASPLALAQETTGENTEEAEIQLLLEQIQELLALVESLRAQLAMMQGGSISPQQIGFSKNLRLGDEDIEVRTLQQILNQDPRTRVAPTGPGSKGFESMYYGKLTADAVKRFQELYASEILTPVGLTSGSGYFGPSTRAKLNAIVRAKSASTMAQTEDISDVLQSQEQTEPEETIGPPGIPPVTDSESLDLSLLTGNEASFIDTSLTSGSGASAVSLSTFPIYEESTEFSVGEASSYAGAPGEFITIWGVKLTNTTKINFTNNYSVTGIASQDGKSLTFVIPDITKGPYELTFTSGSGKDAIRIMDFAITVENATAPEIYSISPSIGPEGSTITIYGSGFTPFGNQVEFGDNIVSNVPSPDGKMLTVEVDSGLELTSNTQYSASGVAEWPLYVYIANANGRINEPGLFIIRN